MKIEGSHLTLLPFLYVDDENRSPCLFQSVQIRLLLSRPSTSIVLVSLLHQINPLLHLPLPPFQHPSRLLHVSADFRLISHRQCPGIDERLSQFVPCSWPHHIQRHGIDVLFCTQSLVLVERKHIWVRSTLLRDALLMF